MEISFASDSSILVRFAGPPSLDNSRRVLNLFLTLQASSLPLLNLHLGYNSLLIDFDPATLAPKKLHADLLKMPHSDTSPAGVLKTVPVRYDGDDLMEVASLTGLTVEAVIQRHSEA